MNFHDILQSLLIDTKGAADGLGIDPTSSLGRFSPELALCGTVVLMLLVRMFDSLKRVNAFYIALAGSLVALYLASPWTQLTASGEIARQEIFTGMLVYDSFSIFIRAVLLLFLVLFTIFTKLSGIPNKEDATDFYVLVIGATIGMTIMATANHLLTVFLGVEMASVPSYALAGTLRGSRKSSEAALKYAIYGAGAAGVMLYGISLLSGVLHTAHLPTVAVQLAGLMAEVQAGNVSSATLMVLSLAGLMIGVGLAFKLSAVPFHFWCPDVFEGAPAEVNAFLSVASKAAALALLVRVVLGVGTLPTEPVAVAAASDTQHEAPADPAADAHAARLPASSASVGLFSVADEPAGHEPDAAAPASAPAGAQPAGAMDRELVIQQLSPVRSFIIKLVAMIAVITCTFGNLAAYGQTNIKRLLAYSTIAHAGYMLMAVPAAMALAAVNLAGAREAIAALCLYVGIYLFMNLGAFAIVAFLRNALGSEEISDYAGLIRRSPGVVICFAIILFSLVGLPPLAGFIGKFAIFAALVDGYQATSNGYLMLLLWVGGINTAISLFYYLNVVKVMTIDSEPKDVLPNSFPLVSISGAYLTLITLPMLGLFVSWDWLNEMAQAAARSLLS